MNLYGRMKLYEISEEVRRLLEEVDLAGGEMTPDLEERLSAATGRLEDKTTTVALWNREKVAEGEAIGNEIERLAKLKHAADSAADWSEAYILRELQHAGVKTIKTATVRATVAKNSKPTVRVACDSSSLPARFLCRITHEHPNRDELLKAHRAGEMLPPGVNVVQGYHLLIS